MSSPASGTRAVAPGAQTVHRALDIVETIAAHERGMAVAEIAAAVGLAAPTTHRLCRTLVERGYLRQLADRRYTLGARLVPLGHAANALVGTDAEAILGELVAALGETANIAVLAGHQAEYVAQVPSRFSMRMFTEVGRRVDLHSTGVGKVLLARLDDEAAHRILRRSGMPAQTEHTITTPGAMLAELDTIRREGYAVDEQEQELGVRCVAVPVADALDWMALSVSGPVTRMTAETVQRAVPLLRGAAQRLAASLGAVGQVLDDPAAGSADVV